MKIGELAKLAGCTVKTIRFYEAEGLLPRPVRSHSGYRLYSERDLKRMQFIQSAKLIGLPLVKIKELLLHLGEEECTCPTIRPHLEQLIRDQVKEIRLKINQLFLLKEELEGFLATIQPAHRVLPDGLCACETEHPPTSILSLKISRKGGSR